MYELIVDAGEHVFKANCLAHDEEELKNRYGGNGEFVRVRDVTQDFPIKSGVVWNALEAAGFGKTELEAVRYLLEGYENTVD
jgi:hypothetical protein